MMSRRLFPALIALGCFVSLDAGAVAIDPSDPDLLYTGRWHHANPSAPWTQAKGSSLIANFEGTSFAVTFSTGSTEYYRIIVDGDLAGSVETTLASGASTTLVSGLSDAIHSIEIVKERDVGRATLTAIELDAGRDLVAPPARPNRRIVFYGDSNLAGYSLESERNEGDAEFQGSTYTYAGITARAVGAEYHNISLSGATLTSLNQRYDRVDWGTNNPGWDFNLFPADVVVVNIGANDIFGGSKTTIKNRYHNLLDDLVADHPTSKIVLYNATGWDFDEPANYTHEVVAERADPDLSVATFPWLFEQFHGCETDHAGMAAYLVAHLETLMGWAPAPLDVVSGYGRDGQLGNASFERLAPFGGWGWRYFDDAGVNRVFDPAGALDGDHYLRLADGATNQQTNPASNGETVVVTTWMRSPNVGDEAKVTIGFRNQDDGAESSAPVFAVTDTFVLTTEWQPFVATATAPVSPPDPIFSQRITLEAGASDTVEVDLVLLPEPTRIPGILIGAFGTGLLLRRRRRRGRSARWRGSDSRGGCRPLERDRREVQRVCSGGSSLSLLAVVSAASRSAASRGFHSA